MISNLSDLVAYTGGLASKVPQIAEEIAIKPAGIADDVVASLVRDMPMPPTYLRCIREVGVFGVSLGYFALWPTFSRHGNLVESLFKANSGQTSGEVAARTASLLVVGRQEANLICVGSMGAERPDVVFLLDVMSSPTVRITSIAPNFEVFLLLAGNLHAVSRDLQESPADASSEMGRCCNHFHCTEEQSMFWQGVIAELVS